MIAPVPRPFQAEAIARGLETLTYKKKEHNYFQILPTGAGKSICIANMAKELNDQLIIFQPSKEILAQNYAKYLSYGYRAGIYSASAGHKFVDQTTFATIGSVINKPHLFKDLKYMIIDECDLVSGKSGMYHDFIKMFPNAHLTGLTATPYRLSSGFNGAMLKFINRTNPRIFNKCSYYVQNKTIFDHGFLSPLKYYSFNVIDRKHLEVNKAGTDFTDASLKAHYKAINMVGWTIHYAKRLLQQRKNLLVFCALISEAEAVASGIPGAYVVHSKLPPHERDSILIRFKNGMIKCLVNVGIVAIGFDFPALECVLLARSTMSLRSYYQWCLDMQTEILTKRGFLTHAEIKQTDIVATYDTKTGEIIWKPILSITYRDTYPGEYFVKARGQHLDFRVTNQHDVIVKCRRAVNYLKEKAENLLLRDSLLWLPVSGVEAAPGANLTDDEIRFLGLFLSDGNLNKTTNAITITQSLSHPLIIEEIERVIKSCGFKYGKHLRKRTGEESKYNDIYHFSVSYGRPIGRDNDKKGWKCIEKFIDKSLNENYELLNEKQFGILLDAINLGDGRKSKVDYKRGTYSIAMGDNNLYSDRIQSLAVRRGFRCNRYIQKRTGFKDQNVLYIKKVSYTTIAGNGVKNNIIKKKPLVRTRPEKEVIEKPEKVWCVENETGTIITRRNGKVMITGNCGRAMRIAPGKIDAWIVDLGHNIKLFGKIETMEIKEKNGLLSIWNNNRQLTNVQFSRE